MIDVAARKVPEVLAKKAASEIASLVKSGRLAYPNLRYSGSGEVAMPHLRFLDCLAKLDVHLWGFSRRLKVARSLRRIGISVIFSCDITSDPAIVAKARQEGFPLAYTSVGVDDTPPDATLVTFPLHRGGHVSEVVDAPSLCPKVVEEYLEGARRTGWCQRRCNRCHRSPR